MKVQLIRNATLRFEYAGKKLLLDPMLSRKGTLDPFATETRNPTVETKNSPEEIVAGVDAVFITHNHPDHFDPAAMQVLSKDLPLFVQPDDLKHIEEAGFTDVTAVESGLSWENISITRTGGRHGSEGMLQAVPQLGNVSGFVLKSADEPVVYIVGDSVWNEEVAQVIGQHNPDIIITNSGGAKLPVPGFENDHILMDAEQTVAVARSAGDAVVIAVHMESLDHCTTGRDVLRKAADAAGIPANRLYIPEDGETVEICG